MKWTFPYRIEGCSPEEFEKLETTGVFKSPDSPTGYVASFRCKAPGQEQMWVIGDWMFSDIHHSSCCNSGRFWPHQWKPEYFPHTLLGLKGTPRELKDQTPGEEIHVETFAFDWEVLKLGLYEMERHPETGVFSCTIPLPSGIFNYQFVLEIPDGNPLLMKKVPDPAKEQNPYWNEKDEKGHLFSQVRVPFSPEHPQEDRSVEMICKSQPGTVHYEEYETDESFGAGVRQPVGIYLPCGYDPKRGKPYPVLYLSHGGGEGEAAWMTKGGVPSLLDNLILEKKAEPMVVVTMSNEVFRWNNKDKCIPNLTQYLMPYIEKNYNVSTQREGRAFAGVSAGGFLAFEIYEAVGQMFCCVGIWSGGRRFQADLSRDALKDTMVHIGAGRYDDGYFAFGAPLENELTDQELPFTSYTPNGGHQWSVWRRLLEDFVTRVFV